VNAPLPSFFRPERRVDVIFTFDARPTEPANRHPNCSKDVLEAFAEFASDHGTSANTRFYISIFTCPVMI
jgi:hypothetical protein